MIRDASQVRATARWLAEADASGELGESRRSSSARARAGSVRSRSRAAAMRGRKTSSMAGIGYLPQAAAWPGCPLGGR